MEGNRRSRLYAGPGARIYQSAFGSRVRFNAAPADFSHPWLAELAGNGAARLLPGFINQVPGAIKGVPLAGTEKKPVPTLTWAALKLTDDGIGYLAAEVTCDAKHDFAVTGVEIVQVADPDTEDGTPGKLQNSSGGAMPLSKDRARGPLAMLQQRSSGQVDVFQITFFNLTHRVKMAADGKTVSRHFFW